jgi:folate-dependent phosphoribosylglycinamide formyltransferase PurN
MTDIPRIILIGTDCTTTWMMVNALRKDYPDLIVAVEKPVHRSIIIKRRIARLGLIKVFGQLLFILLISIIKYFNTNRLQSLITSTGLSSEVPKDLILNHFSSVNSNEFISWLRFIQPKVVIINGTRIISKKVLNSTKAVFLNTHCGITPAYRGVHGAYWALTLGDNNNVGVTIHIVDEGIDTGSILFQEKIQIENYDNFLTYPIKQYLIGTTLMKRAVKEVVAGHTLKYNREDLISKIWHHPTIWVYLWNYFRYGVR